MRLDRLPKSEFTRRIAAVQEQMHKRDLDVLLTYSSETESASSRYLADFWPFFDFAGVVVPAEGEAALITGGPESYEFARRFSSAGQILINPLFVETSAPEWVPEVKGESFQQILPRVCGGMPRRIGITDGGIFPALILDDVKQAAPEAQIVPADDVLLSVKSIKSPAEVPYIRRAYEIVQEATKAALEAARPGLAEYELEAVARKKMLDLGAEGMPYPSWVCSGPNTVLSLCRSTARKIEKGDLVQLSLGGTFMGYCGNMCRPFVLGKIPPAVRKLMDVALEATDYSLRRVRAGVKASDVFAGYRSILAKYGYERFTLYGPAHGTGHSEVEGLWLSESADFVIQPSMLFNIDIWLSDGERGMRYEEGVLTTETGLQELNSYRREVISL